MRERAQASVETIALMAATTALAGALAFGVVRLGPPLAGTIADAVSGAFGGGTPLAPGLDPFERLLAASATSAASDGATLLDLRTSLRARLPAKPADAAFAANVHRLVANVLAAHSIDGRVGAIEVVDQAAEDAWLRDRFHPGRVDRLAHAVVGLAGPPGSILSLAEDFGVVHGALAVPPGHAAGDLVVHIGDGIRELVLRRRPGTGLTVIADRAPVPARGGVR